jgi:putative flavoprotein involved in K+ transport
MGVLDATPDDVHDLQASRRQPSLQLAGTPDRATLDLAVLRSRGVEVTGRAIGVDGSVTTADDLVATTAAADVKLAMLVARIDAFVVTSGLTCEVGPAEPFNPIWPLFTAADTSVHLRARGIATVVWATGFRRAYPWLRLPVLDDDGEIRHEGGVTSMPGLYTLGLPFMRRRRSAFIDGVGDDARHMVSHLDVPSPALVA